MSQYLELSKKIWKRHSPSRFKMNCISVKCEEGEKLFRDVGVSLLASNARNGKERAHKSGRQITHCFPFLADPKISMKRETLFPEP